MNVVIHDVRGCMTTTFTAVLLSCVIGVTLESCTEKSLYDASTTGVVFHSDGYPKEIYGGNREDCWIIQNGDGGGIELNFKDFKTEWCCDEVFVYEFTETGSWREIAKLFGTVNHNLRHVTDRRKIKVKFTSDKSTSYKGWQACACPKVCCQCQCPWLELSNATMAKAPGRFGTNSSIYLAVGIVGGLVVLCIIIGVITYKHCPGRYSHRRRRGNSPDLDPVPAGNIEHSTGTPMRPVPQGQAPRHTGPSMMPVPSGYNPRPSPMRHAPPSGYTPGDPGTGQGYYRPGYRPPATAPDDQRYPGQGLPPGRAPGGYPGQGLPPGRPPGGDTNPPATQHEQPDNPPSYEQAISYPKPRSPQSKETKDVHQVAPTAPQLDGMETETTSLREGHSL